jgi:hypothetical protein
VDKEYQLGLNDKIQCEISCKENGISYINGIFEAQKISEKVFVLM